VLCLFLKSLILWSSLHSQFVLSFLVFFFLKAFLFLNVFFFIVDNLFMLAYALSTPLEVFLHLMFFLMPWCLFVVYLPPLFQLFLLWFFWAGILHVSRCLVFFFFSLPTLCCHSYVVLSRFIILCKSLVSFCIHGSIPIHFAFFFFTFLFSLVSVLCCTWGHGTSLRSHHLVI